MSRVRSAALVAVSAAGLGVAGCDAIETPVGAWDSDVRRAFYFEAESGEVSGGFEVTMDPSASGGEYLAPPAETLLETEVGGGRSRYALELAEAGDYRIWGRLRTPDAVQNRFWIQVDGGAFTLWRMSVGDIWYWDDVHDNAEYGVALVYPLARGAHELVVANAVAGAALDRFYVTAEGDEPPGNDTTCNPPHTIASGGECLPSCGTLAGTTCGVAACAGFEPLPAYDCDVCCRIEP